MSSGYGYEPRSSADFVVCPGFAGSDVELYLDPDIGSGNQIEYAAPHLRTGRAAVRILLQQESGVNMVSRMRCQADDMGVLRRYGNFPARGEIVHVYA